MKFSLLLCNVTSKLFLLFWQTLRAVQEDGLATRAPTTSVLSESHIQYLEHYYITTILNKHNTNYFRHVEDLGVVYKY